MYGSNEDALKKPKCPGKQKAVTDLTVEALYIGRAHNKQVYLPQKADIT